MDLTSRPLGATPRARALFAGRGEEISKILHDLDRGFSVLVVGPRGSGKTSTLAAIHRDVVARDGSDQRIVYVRAAGLGEPAQVLNAVLDAVEDRDIDEGSTLSARRALQELAEQHADRSAGGLVVLLDDVDPAVGNLLFGVLRDDLWDAGVQWVVTANPSDASRLLTPPADAFFESTLELGPLDRNTAIEMLIRRLEVPSELEVDAEALKAIAGDGGQPREILERARQIDLTQGAEFVREQILAEEGRLANLTRSARMLYAEIGHSGPISASDKSVQEAMGWTRPRLVQVLGELEQAGLVTAAEQPQSGPGRPRKLYYRTYVPPMDGNSVRLPGVGGEPR